MVDKIKDNNEMAEDLRVQALELLRQAQELDNKKPFLIVHEHQYGTTPYITFAENEPNQFAAEEVLTSEFEEELGESMMISSLNIAELIGHPELLSTVSKHSPG